MEPMQFMHADHTLMRANSMSDSVCRPRRGPRVACWVLLLIVAASTLWSLMRVGLFFAPARDEGHYVVLGWRCTLGERIYVDFYDGAQKPPLMYWMAGAAVKLVGRKAAVFPFLRVVTILVKTATLLLIFFIGRRLASGFVGLVGAALFGFHALVARVGNQVMTEPYSTLLALLGLWIFLKSQLPSVVSPARSRWRRVGCFASGLLIAVGMLYRPTPIFLGVVIGIAILAAKQSWRAKLSSFALFAGGGLLGLLPLIVYLVVNGAFYNFYLMMFRFMNAYPPERYDLHFRLMHLKMSFLSPEYYGWLAVLAAVIGLVRALKARSVPWLMLGGWLGLQLVMALTLRRVEWHYHYEFLPAFVLLFGLGFQRLLELAKDVYAGLRTKERIYWLLEDGRLLPLVSTLLLPIPIWVLVFRLQSVALSWRAGLRLLGGPRPERWLVVISWPVLALLAGSSLMITWKNRYKYHLFLFALVLCSGMALSSAQADVWALCNSGAALGLSFTFALGGWLWRIGQALPRWCGKAGRGWHLNLGRRLARLPDNLLLILLWLFFLWLFIGQARILVRYGPTRSKLEDAKRAAGYIRARLSPGNEIISARSDIIFLVGKPFPTYWGAPHEEVAAKLGIAKMVGRELADMPGYFDKHQVQFVVFASNEPRLNRAGEDYLDQHFGQYRLIGPYWIYERKSVATSPRVQ